MDLKRIYAALQTGWHLLVIGALVAAGVAIAADRSQVPVYEAHATYVVSPGGAVEPGDLTSGVNTLDSSRSRSIMTTLTEITDSAAVRAQAVGLLGLDPSTVEEYAVTSIVVPEANVMDTGVSGPDPAVAALLASTIGGIGGQRFVDLYLIYDVGVLDPATEPTTPSNPGLSQILVVAVAIGLMAGGAAAVLGSAWLERPRRSMSQRLGAYAPAVTPIEEHTRFKRVG